ncbi:ABC transporter ATP-binding protein [Pseudokineococcus lusitanus]|uniref:Iron complex transport system ATP-binding protein n=1 Tax=Pseudokineococcus lusitanus TaxID=763993 RepID=A0A3N1HTG9_9ACTN|nr:ABC transporter ATP-binding protein [Pseudokineococcus lusitanus]ROP45815.1 iron complex transport system ATP-binding protein [Pseudokineococcus lusitanus]
MAPTTAPPAAPAAVDPLGALGGDGTPPPALVARGVSVEYSGRRVVHEVDLEVPSGQVSVVVGANGCGKSSLLRALARLQRPATGRVTLDGRDVARTSPRAFASVVGLLPQHPLAPEGITVGDLVGRGRHPHHGPFQRWSAEDDRVVARALAVTRTHDLAGRRVEELSGGQRQRVWVAMVLAQQPRVLLLDEPTTYLDVAHQVEVLQLLRDLNRSAGTTVLMVLHDLNMAARYADHLVVMAGGRVHAQGRPEEVLTERCVRDAFALESVVLADPVTGGPLVVPR